MPDLVMIEAYKFEELSAEAKQRVIDWLAAIMPDMWQDDSDFWLDQFKELGYEDVDFQYSGFYCQGDGASIACNVDVKKFISRNKLGNSYRSLLYCLKNRDVYGMALVTRNRWGHYVHEKLLRVSADGMVQEISYYEDDEEYGANARKAADQVESLLPAILSEVQEKSREVYKALQTNYDYHLSEEYAADMCAANEYLFNGYGECIHHLVVAPKNEEIAQCQN